jgi:uncharacterized protein with HEPN domain
LSVAKGALPLEQLLAHMARAIARIAEDVADTDRETFLSDDVAGRRMRDTCILNIGHLGEIANDIRVHFPAFAAENPALPFDEIYAMRNIVFHGYHAIDDEIVWQTATIDIPKLGIAVREAQGRLLAHTQPSRFGSGQNEP